MIFNLLNSYMAFNLTFIVLVLIFFSVRKISERQKLRLMYLSLILTLTAVIVQPWIPKHDYVAPGLRVWSPSTSKTVLDKDALVNSTTYVSLSSEVEAPKIETTMLFQILAFVLSALLLTGVGKIFRELMALKKLEKKSLLYKKWDRVEIFLNEKIHTPFSYYRWGRLITMLPTELIHHPAEFKAAMLHEFQHHRQGDTFWAYPLIMLKKLCFFNPFIHLFVELLHETQEFSCDEAVVSETKVPLASYIGCLILVAQTSVNVLTEPGCATGFCFSRQQNILKRRIEKMNTNTVVPLKSLSVKLIALSLVGLLSFTTWASRNLVQDRKLTMGEARELLKAQSDFPLLVNEQVLEQLNTYLGTQEGRTFMREALNRKSGYSEILSATAREHGTSELLNAIPVVESGFINRARTGRIKAAGIWMFMPPAARRFGMKVDGQVDERLDVVKETDGAHRYLAANQLLFKDWHLAVLAYNIGEVALRKAIVKHQTRNAWELIEKGLVTDRNYLPKVIASMIIMKNPDLLKN